MPTILAVSGILIDRAFPGLGQSAAQRRRALTMSAVVKIIGLARQHNVDAIVIVGGLFDGQSVGIHSISAAMQILDTFDGVVLIAPGARDPFDEDGEYGGPAMGNRARVWRTSSFTEGASLDGARILGRASKRPSGGDSRLPDVDPAQASIVIGDGIDVSDAAAWASRSPNRHVITTGDPEQFGSGVTVLAPVNADVGHPFGQAVLVTVEAGGRVATRAASVLEGSPATVDVDVTDVADTIGLAKRINSQAETIEPWSVLRLSGELPQGVLLPSTIGSAPVRDDIILDESALSFAFTEPASGDRTALAEFLRSAADAAGDDKVRHQAIALGLQALGSVAREVAAL